MQILGNFILPSINHKDIIAFACNTKSFEIAFVFFSLFFLPSMAFGRTDKSFLFMFLSFITQEACDQDWALFIGYTENVFVSVLVTLKFRVSKRSIPCALEIVDLS